MKTTGRIAAEAWEKILMTHRNFSRITGETAIAIIKAAIEEAYRNGLNEGFGKGKQAGIRDQIYRAAQASEK